MVPIMVNDIGSRVASRERRFYPQEPDKTPSPQERLRALKRCYEEHIIISEAYRGDTKGHLRRLNT